MRKILSMCVALIFCFSFVYAEDQSQTENNETQNLPPYCTLSFDLTKKAHSAEPSFFAFNKLDNDQEDNSLPKINKPFAELNFSQPNACSSFLKYCYSNWHLYKAQFGFEKVYVRFPHSPVINQGNSLTVAYTYDHEVLYSLSGYFPPIGNIDPVAFFDTALFNASQYPYALLSYSIYQVDFFWILDYVMHDTYKDMIVKNRTIVTPFNAYTLQAVAPYGFSTRFDYFIDSFKLKTVP